MLSLLYWRSILLDLRPITKLQRSKINPPALARLLYSDQ